MIRIEIETNNAAFEGGCRNREIARILADLAHKAKNGVLENTRKIVDYNGNTCGSISIKGE